MDQDDIEVAEALASARDITLPGEDLREYECLIRGKVVGFMAPYFSENYWDANVLSDLDRDEHRSMFKHCKTLEEAIRVYLENYDS